MGQGAAGRRRAAGCTSTSTSRGRSRTPATRRCAARRRGARPRCSTTTAPSRWWCAARRVVSSSALRGPGRRRGPTWGRCASGSQACSTRSVSTSPATGMPRRSSSGRPSPDGACRRSDSPEFARLEWPLRLPGALLLQRLDEPSGPVRGHVDLACDDVRAECDRHLGLGAQEMGQGVAGSCCVTPNGARVLLHRTGPAHGWGRCGLSASTSLDGLPRVHRPDLMLPPTDPGRGPWAQVGDR